MRLGSIIAPGFAKDLKTFGLKCIVKKEFTNQNS